MRSHRVLAVVTVDSDRSVSVRLPCVQTYQHDGWSALGDRTRRAIFERLVDRPCAVGELADGLPVSRPAVSQHLKVLKDAGLVVDHAVGNRRIYRVNPDGLGRAARRPRPVLDQRAGRLQGGRRTTRTRRSHEHTSSSDVVRHADRRRRADRAGVLGLHRATWAASSRPSTTCSASRSPKPCSSRGSGGRVYDRGVDGSECRWARVLAYEPPDRVVISWDISPQWQIETDLEKTSEVEVRFIAETPERTRVELEHRNLDRHGDGWEAVRDGVDGGDWMAAVPAAVRRRSGRVS